MGDPGQSGVMCLLAGVVAIGLAMTLLIGLPQSVRFSSGLLFVGAGVLIFGAVQACRTANGDHPVDDTKNRGQHRAAHRDSGKH
ncbi:hypothetical protein AB0P21_39990 [Kribbella sp. NPDC056861]|uniref:hypothetical protein n=1 Tax=Kribbella sp. NPDC056861 TaxID=3154857 RepID=UPI00341A139A